MTTVASGSSGNCVYIGSDHTHILVDAGISKKRIEEGLHSCDIDLKDIQGIMITHEHSDHICGLGVVSRKYHIPIMGTAATLQAIKENPKLGAIDTDLFVAIEKDTPVQIGDLSVLPFQISHDAADPVGYRISHGQQSVAVATDMGKYDDYIISNLSGLDGIVLEANHDVNMLLAGAYPYYLKQRILSDRGHLSNENSGKLLDAILHDNLKYIALGHLSKENNYEELALQTVVTEIAMSASCYKPEDFDIRIAERDRCSALMTF
jgi:phosphoribosyl 1,2-cyclic phosphodiesterase